MKNKVLIITYYWPPSGGSGVQRWVKFTKYLRDFGWEPVIYTPENPEIPASDPALMKDIPEGIRVLKTPITEPYYIYKKLTGKKEIAAGFTSETKKKSVLESISKWIRGNLFIPDARKFWINPSVSYLTDFLKDNQIKALATTGPPHSMHLIGLKLSKNVDIPWLADFRDPWTNIDFYDELMLTKWADRKHHKLEKEVLTKANRVVTVTPTMKEQMETIRGSEVHLITNGFDYDDFNLNESNLDSSFTITHVGTMGPTRNPINLWQVLAELAEENDQFKKDLKIQLIGKVDFAVTETIESVGLKNHLYKPGYLPHEEATEMQQHSRILLLVLNDTPNARCLLPGKVFEYLAAKRPIISIGPEDGDIASIMNLDAEYFLVGYDKNKPLKAFIERQYQNYKHNLKQQITADIDRFSRRKLTEKLADLLNEMTTEYETSN